MLNRLASEFPEVPEYRQKVTDTSIQLNILLAEARPLEAERVIQEALAEQEKFVAAFPEVPEYANVLGRDYYGIGRFLVGRGNPTGAEPYLERAIRHHRAVLKEDSKNPTYRSYLGEDLVVWANALIALGDHARAADAAEELPWLLPDNLRRHYDAAAFLVRCARRRRETPSCPSCDARR